MNILAWKNRFNPFIVQELIRIGEQSCLEVQLSPEELLIIRSCVAAGANIYYPDKQISIEHWLDDMEECMTCCSEILDAIAQLATALTALQDGVSGLTDAQAANAASDAIPPDSMSVEAICGGSLAVVMAMDAINRQTYADTEGGIVDSVFELIPRFIAAVPLFGVLPFDELYELVNMYFEHQVENYIADFDDVKDGMVEDLSCRIQGAGGAFTFDVWADWLLALEASYPFNAAASLYSRYAAARQTFINQIAALVNKDGSLQAYFDTLATAYVAGLDNPVACANTCDWSHVFDFTLLTLPEFCEIYAGLGTHTPGLGVLCNFNSGGETNVGFVQITPVSGNVSSMTVFASVPNSTECYAQVIDPVNGGTFLSNGNFIAPAETEVVIAGLPATFDAAAWRVGLIDAGNTEGYLQGVSMSGFGVDPFV